jgi:hypothetical protein
MIVCDSSLTFIRDSDDLILVEHLSRAGLGSAHLLVVRGALDVDLAVGVVAARGRAVFAGLDVVAALEPLALARRNRFAFRCGAGGQSVRTNLAG